MAQGGLLVQRDQICIANRIKLTPHLSGTIRANKGNPRIEINANIHASIERLAIRIGERNIMKGQDWRGQFTGIREAEVHLFFNLGLVRKSTTDHLV